MLAPLFFLAFQAQPAAPAASADEQKCVLEGQVISASTGSPLKHASLRLQPMGPVSGGATRTGFTSSTDAEGKFVMTNVDPGTYQLMAQHAGFVPQTYGARANSGGTRLKLDGGQSMKDLLFKLVPQAMVYGRVVDDDGQPVPSVRIQVQRSSFINGKKQLRPAGGGISQADGSFVLALAAGRVVLSAEPVGNGMAMGEIDKAAGKTDDAFLTTYFPNTLDVSSAAPVELQPGMEMRGIEIHMRRGRMYQVRGHIQNTTSGAPPEGVSLSLFHKGETFFTGRNQFYVQGKSGVFLFKNLLPGDYVIQTWGEATATSVDASGETRSTRLEGRVEVSVGDSDVDNVVLPLGPGLEIAGAISVEGGAQQQTSQPPDYTIILSSADGPIGYANARASAEGNFRLHNVAQGTYRVSVNGTPDGSYVKAIRFGGEDITGKNLDLTSGAGGDLQIIVSPNAADISGVVRNADGDAASGVMVQAFLGDDLKHSANTDQNGAFHFTSLAPGNYRVYAWEDIESGLSQDPDFRKNFDSKAAEAKLEEKGHESLEVKLISKDAIDTEAAKVQ